MSDDHGHPHRAPDTCIYVNETMATDGGFIPVVVVEDEAGYTPLSGGDDGQPWVWGPTIGDAQQQVAECNADLGLTTDDVFRIIASSMAAAQEEREDR
jgi:hypothetical protein